MNLLPTAPKVRNFVPIVFLLFAYGFLLLGKSVGAQVPVPSTPVPCGKVTDPEFHSLRPYQASPCNEKISGAAFCGNGIAITEQVSRTQSTSPSKDPDCTLIDARTSRYECTYNTHVERNIAIDLSDAELPILGNTEQVTNSQNQNEELDDAEKTNEYVSWYLSGTTWKPEYSLDSADKLVNFSGPINKLLPWDIQAQARIETIKRAGVDRHNQVVTPDGTRLEAWEGEIAPSLLSIPAKLYDLILPDWLVVFGEPWNERIPPLAKDFEDDLEYRKAYQEWRGKSCVIVTMPIVNLRNLLCVENLLRPNEWANNFSYIPLSSTEDREGSVAITEFGIKATSPDAEVKNQKFTNQTPAELFFAHTEEASELATLLQSTYAPGGSSAGSAPSVGIAPNNCSLVNIRSNPGDQLFPGEISGDLSYDIEFSCDYEIPDTGWKPKECQKDVLVSLGTITKTPLADEIWAKLVAGSRGVFKRIYPKVGEGGALECLADIPAATEVTYQGEGLGVVTNPEERAGQSPELYFPHLGGVYEYFLKGIQTALRPKGYGEQVIAGQNCQNLTCSSGKIGGLPELPPTSGSCGLSNKSRLGGADLSKLPTLVKIVEAAADAYKTPPGLILGIMYGEGVFNEGRYEWTDENVRNWSMGCTTMPSCTPGVWPSEVVHYYEPYWESVKDAVKVVDPSREPNPCNLMDNIFAIARDLHGNSGAPSFAGKTCFGIPLKTGAANPNSCSWGPSDIETAIKVWETGAQDMCVTERGGCATGGLSAVCSKGGDNCEKVTDPTPHSSHNGCVWDVSQKYK